MAIQNEVFKFVAEVELDEKTTEEFTKALKVANDHCDELRQTIAKNQKELMKMSAAGKENTEEFKKLGEQLNQTKDKLKASSKEDRPWQTIFKYCLRQIRHCWPS